MIGLNLLIMNKEWNPKIKRKRINVLPEKCLRFFHSLLTLVENDESNVNHYNWKNLEALKKDLLIESDTKKNKIRIPKSIKLGSLYLRGYNKKPKILISNLRHAFGHNYIQMDEKENIKIALPNRNKTELKFVCYLPFKDLVRIVETLSD